MKITYFLGAGASYHSLPTYVRKEDEFYSDLSPLIKPTHYNIHSLDETGKRLFDKHNFLHRLILFRNKFWLKRMGGNYSKINEQQETNIFLTDLNDLIFELQKHVSIDTVAKKYFLVPGYERKLLKLKALLSCFFICEQLTNHYDQRYDTFLASFMAKNKDDFEFDKNVRVVTWNYDTQFELAFNNYLLDGNFSVAQEKLNTFPFIQNQNDMVFKQNRFGIVRLNGVAGFYLDNDSWIRPVRHQFTEVDQERILIDIIQVYNNFINETYKISSVLSYSWERSTNKLSNDALEYAKQIFRGTDKLVIIGYSFPFFNRLVDNELMDTLNRVHVYVQDPRANEIISILTERYPKKISFKNTHPISENLQSFFIPSH